jgi:hypothetical protein
VCFIEKSFTWISKINLSKNIKYSVRNWANRLVLLIKFKFHNYADTLVLIILNVSNKICEF